MGISAKLKAKISRVCLEKLNQRNKIIDERQLLSNARRHKKIDGIDKYEKIKQLNIKNAKYKAFNATYNQLDLFNKEISTTSDFPTTFK